MSGVQPKQLDELVKGLPTFRATSTAARIRSERDDGSTIYAVRSLGDLTREVLRRLPPNVARNDQVPH
jgi:hypothetical protein